MKYNVLDLVVVESDDNSSIDYLICKKDKGAYYEVLTNRFVKIKNEETSISPLMYYYAENDIDYKTLKLGKKEILDKYIEINEFYRMHYRNKRSENNKFGDKNYFMKDSYQADNLVVAELRRLANDFDFEELSVAVITTEQKYLFEIVWEDGKMKYREVFTGFIAEDKAKYFGLPYVGNPRPLVEVLPELEHSDLSKLNLIMVSNDINNAKNIQSKRRL